MSTKQRIGYIWDYYKWHIFFVFFLLSLSSPHDLCYPCTSLYNGVIRAEPNLKFDLRFLTINRFGMEDYHGKKSELKRNVNETKNWLYLGLL